MADRPSEASLKLLLKMFATKVVAERMKEKEETHAKEI